MGRSLFFARRKVAVTPPIVEGTPKVATHWIEKGPVESQT